MARDLKERIEASIIRIPESTCWYWDKQINNRGYGMMKVGSKVKEGAHRISYKVFIGEIPDGYEIDHLCRNRSCVNPKHLEAVVHKENVRRGDNFQRAKTHCPNGHEYSSENTYMWGPRKSYRVCKICHLSRNREWKAKIHATR